jgi:hypothetical protein
MTSHGITIQNIIHLKFNKLIMPFEPQKLYDVILNDTVIAGKNEKKMTVCVPFIMSQSPSHVTHSARTMHPAV